ARLRSGLLALKRATSPAQRGELVDGARSLGSLAGVFGLGAIEALPGGDADLVLFFAIEGLGGLEAFGTDPRYVAFLQKTVAPVLSGLSGADVLLDGAFPAIGNFGACLALTAPAATYDWQVRNDLGDWAKVVAPDASALGLAVGERQRYRGVAVAFPHELKTPLAPPPFGYGALTAAGPALALA